MHWAEKYIGEPWVAGVHDCWAFVRRVWAEQFGRDVPAVDVDACNKLACVRAFTGHDDRANWELIDTPYEGCAVLLSQSQHPSHVGVWVDVDGGGVLHCVEHIGVIFQTISSLRLSGWNKLEYYQPCT